MLGFLLGTVVQLQQSTLLPWWVNVAMLGLAVLLFLAGRALRRPGGLGMVLVALALALLGFGVTGWRASAYLADALNPNLEGRDVQVRGIVANLPQRNESGLRFRLEIESGSLQGQVVRLPPVMDVAWYGGANSAGPALWADARTGPSGTPMLSPSAMNTLPADVRAGERWDMTVRLKAPHGSRNPNGFDYELWLWEQGVQATGYVRSSAKDPAPQRLEQTWHQPVALARQIVRERIYREISERKFAGMIAALVVGDQAAIDHADWDVFRATGVAHLVSISGLHITMFAWLAARIVSWLWRRSSRLCLWFPATHAAVVGGVLLATAYSVFSGWGIPSQRTCLMLTTVAVLRLSGARWPWPLVWLLTCAVVVACDPWALLQAGFWLSFVAVGVLFASDAGVRPATPATATGTADSQPARWVTWAGKFAHSVVGNLREQWVITVALTPLTMLLFGQVSLVGLAANALAIPWITLVVTPLAMLGVFVPFLWGLAGGAMAWLFAYLHGLASWSWASVALPVPPVWAAAAGVLGGLLMVLPWSRSLRVLGLPMLLPALLWRASVPPLAEFDLLAPDIGQGNAVQVRTANHALLYDAGPRFSVESDAGHRVLVPLLQSQHTQLDMLILSHKDLDHVGGAPAVLTMQPQAELLSSIEAGNPLQALRAARPCVAGQHWEWDGVQFDILHPQADDYLVTNKANAMSCVLRISNGRQTALLVGDIEKPQEERLVAAAAALHADVLLVPHHGSKTSSSAEFLDAVAPRIAIVQSGYRNRFGHPTATVMERLHERHVEVVDSPHCGAFTWQSWQAQNGACFRSENLRYWHHHVP